MEYKVKLIIKEAYCIISLSTKYKKNNSGLPIIAVWNNNQDNRTMEKW